MLFSLPPCTATRRAQEGTQKMKFILKDRVKKEGKSFTFRVDANDYKRLARLSKKRGLSMAEIVRQAIHFILEDVDLK